MPNLVFTISPYVPFTKILSASINQDKTDIQSRLNWSGTAGDTTTGLDGTNIQSTTAIAVVNASLTAQGLTVTALPGQGAAGNSITLAFTGGATAGGEVVSVTGTAVSVQVQSGVSTITQVVTALNATASPSLSLITASGSGSSTVSTASALNLTGGVSSSGIPRSTKLQLGTAQGFVANDATGALQTLNSAPNQTLFTNNSGVQTVGQLSPLAGGTGLNAIVGNQNPGDVFQVNASKTGIILTTPPTPASVRLFQYQNFA